MIRFSASMRSFAAFLLVAVLATRMLVPAGWMPSTEKAFAITVCTGIDTQTVWLSTDGKTHKQDPTKTDSADHQPCTFAGGSFTHLPSEGIATSKFAPAQSGVPSFQADSVTIGQGLAAPPPPSTGPPCLI
ncbi:MAG: hypothetical protein RSE16_11650 [Sphingobium sp.]|nr:MAG: hypothetical protein RSE16_11650 [Sphingobium sp.]